jgi:hypothetical protein
MLVSHRVPSVNWCIALQHVCFLVNNMSVDESHGVFFIDIKFHQDSLYGAAYALYQRGAVDAMLVSPPAYVHPQCKLVHSPTLQVDLVNTVGDDKTHFN